jgi:hypothetical protein
MVKKLLPHGVGRARRKRFVNHSGGVWSQSNWAISPHEGEDMASSNKEPATGPQAKAEGEHWGRVLDTVTSEELAKPNDSDPEALAVTAVTEIDKLTGELVSARDYLNRNGLNEKLHASKR